MANRFRNAAFLELAAGWTGGVGSGPGALAVDEAVRGSPGRSVLLGTGPIRTAEVDRPDVNAGDVVEISARVTAGSSSAPAAATVTALFFGSGGGQVAALPVTVLPAAVADHGEGVLGVRDSLQRAWSRIVAPAGTATVGLEVSGAGEVVLQRPFVDVVPAGRARPLAWDPGVHVDADLTRPIWPQILRPFQSGPGGEPQPGRIEFGEGGGRPASRRTALDPVRRFAGRLRCDEVERAALDAFWRLGAPDFWLVDPSTDQLCVAAFAADGQPRVVETRGVTSIVELGLWLETA